MQVPTLRDIYRAKKTIAPYIARTPLHYSSGLSEMLSAEVYLKHEEHLPLGAFKGRGGINLLANLSDEEKERGLITASSGNHGQSMASACKLFGVKAVIGLPEDANPNKVAAMRALGAELVFHGADFDAARLHCERLAKEEGYRFVHPVNDPLLIAGVATQALETLEDLPDVEVLMLPLGGGSGISGACIVAKGIDPSIEVLAVQSEQAQAGYLSWKKGEIVESEMNTVAEGIATRSGYELAQQIMADLLDDFLLVSEDEIHQAIGTLVDKAHTLAEGAGATALAGAIRYPEKIKGKKVAITISGGNITVDQLRESLKVYQK
ncbi:MAG TPA: threonine/serine dehydratase [Dehalococcoidia bacterium]|nr:MAG: threonine ammonia-lyase [SAR202 cluster bacterium MP-SAtl-SRR3965592-G1]PKB85118.1 MAG: threonine ammonia-lyase [SAR202 cluster bacterium MP-NPac-SRR3961935-G1]HIM62610.1 threonine/serine dehydratase [Dehalococcoidia bacterium]HIN24754.1 threonine/serine dehydratase [Dehalococcoidia bacterium]